MSGKQRIYSPGESRLKRGAAWLWGRFLDRTWFIHQPVTFFINATSQTCVQTLQTATRPSTDRLHHRNLFLSGRRYHFQGRRDGFRLTTTAAKRWRYPKRTASSIVMWGTFNDLDEHLTRLTLRSRADVGFLIDALLVPSGITLLMSAAPWPPGLMMLLAFLLYALSWGEHRSQMVLEAREMIWFTQRVLDDLEKPERPLLGQGTSQDVIYDRREFDREWELFYRDQMNDQNSS
jgi:hypothetical protein